MQPDNEGDLSGTDVNAKEDLTDTDELYRERQQEHDIENAKIARISKTLTSSVSRLREESFADPFVDNAFNGGDVENPDEVIAEKQT